MRIICDICWGEILDEHRTMNLECGHIFHDRCIDDLRERSLECPNCGSHSQRVFRCYLNLEQDEEPPRRQRRRHARRAFVFNWLILFCHLCHEPAFLASFEFRRVLCNRCVRAILRD